MAQRPGPASGTVEVVEIKNVCPFFERAKVNRKGHITRTYFVSNKGPSQSVHHISSPPTMSFVL